MSASPLARALADAPAPRPAPAEPIVPVFVLSAPRSGSTLVQRVLSVHPDVATASEPWLLLPLLAPLRARFAPGGRWHAQLAPALHDFAATLPGGAGAYRAAMRDAALRLYREAAGSGPRFFLDKTPPYALLADELLAAFPDARVLILWRNPLAVVASIVETFCGGRWRPDDYAVSLFDGLDALVAAARRHAGRVTTVRFEQLVGGDPDVWRATAGALGLPFDDDALEEFAGVRLDGRLGDPTGVRAYDALSRAPLEKWRATLAPPLRRAWCRRYLRWIGDERLATMGYALDDLLAQLDALGPPHGAPRDEPAVARAATTARDAADLARTLTRDALRAQLVRPRPPSSWRRLFMTS